MMPRRSYIANLVKLAPALALASLAGAGCVDGPTDTESDDPAADVELPADLDSVDEKTMAHETLYMRHLFAGRHVDEGLGFMKLDLSDDTQFRFLAHRLARSGKTPENSPRLYEGLKRMRAAHIAMPPVQPVIGEGPIASGSQALVSDPCGHFLESPVESNPSVSTVTTQSHVNCFEGGSFPYAYTDVATYETDETESYLTPLDYTSTESFTGAADFATSEIATALAVNIGLVHYVDAISYAEDGNGNIYSTFASFSTSAGDVTASLTTTHPADFTGDGVIRNCIKRAAWAGNGDCDYAGVDTGGLPSQNAAGVAKVVNVDGTWRADSSADNRWFPTSGFAQFQNLYVPLAGTFDAGTFGSNNCNISSFGAARAVMTLQTGGWCSSSSSAQYLAIKDELNANKNGRYSSYNVLGDFGPDCLSLATSSANTVPVMIALSATANVTCGGRRTATRIFRNVDFKDSCFAQGTGILRSDGKHVAVEEIKVGDQVMTSEEGTPLTVVSVSRGGEGHPLVQILDSKGHSLMLTEKHPVVTSMGVLTADAVQPGSEVETESGPAVIVEVDRVPYSELVYNLTLGTPEELARVTASDRTMFAGGIRVGDNAMQADLAKASVPAARTEVAADWKQDHANAVARGAHLHGAE